MKHIFFIIAILTTFSMTYAQQWEWAIQENVRKLAVDSAGNIFSQNNSTIKRLNPRGLFQWQKQYTGDLLISDMVADNSGNLYIAGGFTDFSIDAKHFFSLGSKDIFFCKFDSLGTLLWNKVVAGPNDENVTDLYLNKKQEILICGHVGIGAVIGSKLFSKTELFAAKYDRDGNLNLLFNHSGGDAWEVSADTMGNIYLLGGINKNDALDFGNGVILKGYDISDPFGSHFIAKFDIAGDVSWAKDLGTNYYQPHKHLETDNNENFYLTKWQRYSGFDLYKFDPTGNSIWKHNISGTYGECFSICIDNNDSIWLTGNIWNGDFKGQPFIWELDPSNNLKGATSATTSANGNNIANDYYNNIYVSGTFKDTATFGATTLFATAGNHFLAKMKRDPERITSINNISEDSDAMYLFPNPSTGKFYISLNSSWQNPEICIYDLFGRNIYHQQVDKPENYQIDLSKLEKGIYWVEVRKENKKLVQKIVIQ